VCGKDKIAMTTKEFHHLLPHNPAAIADTRSALFSTMITRREARAIAQRAAALDRFRSTSFRAATSCG
jgi:hypothetical protein